MRRTEAQAAASTARALVAASDSQELQRDGACEGLDEESLKHRGQASPGNADYEELEEEPSSGTSSSEAPGRSRTRALKACLRWTGFLTGILLELVIHARYGLSKSTFEAEEDCRLRYGDFPFRCRVLVFCEIVCRICLTVVLSGMLWEFGRAVLHGAVGSCLVRTYSGHHRSPHQTAAPTVVFSSLVAALGIWCALAEEEDMPLWACVACHVADTFCHGIILSALLGIAFDFGLALLSGKLVAFLRALVLCYDTIEAHGVTGEDRLGSGSSGASDEEQEEEEEAEEERNAEEGDGACTRQAVKQPFGGPNVLKQQMKVQMRPAAELARAAFIWAAFLLTLWAAVLDSYFPDLAPEWASKATKLEGCLCWAGIAWWLAQAVVNCEHRCLHEPGNLSYLGVLRDCGCEGGDAERKGRR